MVKKQIKDNIYITEVDIHLLTSDWLAHSDLLKGRNFSLKNMRKWQHSSIFIIWFLIYII